MVLETEEVGERDIVKDPEVVEVPDIEKVVESVWVTDDVFDMVDEVVRVPERVLVSVLESVADADCVSDVERLNVTDEAVVRLLVFVFDALSEYINGGAHCKLVYGDTIKLECVQMQLHVSVLKLSVFGSAHAIAAWQESQLAS